jgi:bile acid:Na+ symporter, BASS family
MSGNGGWRRAATSEGASAPVDAVKDNLLITIGLPIATAIMMCGIGLTLVFEDFRRLSRSPRPIVVGLVGHYVVLPLLGFAVASLFAQRLELAVGFVLLASCPSAHSSNALTLLARGNTALAVTLTVASSLITFVSVPLLVDLALSRFGGAQQAIRLPLVSTLLHLSAMVLLPVLFGMGLRRYASGFARRLERWVNALTLTLLLLLIVAIAWTERDLVVSTLPQLGPAAVAMSGIAMAAGFGLARIARLDARDAVTIGIEVSIQNCALAVVIALTLLGSTEIALPAGIYALLMYPVAFVVVALARRRMRMREAA